MNKQHRIHPLNGTDKNGGEQYNISTEIIRVIPITSKAISNERLLLLLDKYDNAFIYPNTEEAKVNALNVMTRLTFSRISESKNVLTGYKFSSKGLNGVEIWRINFQNTGEEIIAHASDDQLSPDEYQGIVENDGNITYKYVDPNLMAVATVSSPSNLNIYVINRVNGAILHISRVYNVDRKKAVKMIFAENIILVNYFKEYGEVNGGLLNEVLAIELYYPTIEDDAQKMIFRYLSDGIQVGGVNSVSLPKPRVLMQTYVLPVVTKDLLLTKTLQGITNKHLVLLTNENKVIAMPAILFSAKRPTDNPNRDGTEFEDSTLIPYDSVIHVSHTFILNYNLELNGITQIKSLPQEYESTTLMIASGIDLFVSQFAPEKVKFFLTPRNMMA
jgi:hypothetical protein